MNGIADRSIRAGSPRGLRRSMRPPRTQRGAIAVMTALVFMVIVALAALAIDITNLTVARNELQDAADASAMAGAACLYPRAACAAPGNPSLPDWATADQRARDFVSRNSAQNAALADSTVAHGYWDITGAKGLQPAVSTFTPLSTDIPAVKVIISKQASQNGGAVTTLVAGLLGVGSVASAAQAVAVISSPGYAGTGELFPMAIPKCLFDQYWNSATGLPVVDASGQPIVFQTNSFYHAPPCQAGQWTSFTVDNNDVPTIRGLIANGTPTAISIGTDIWIQPGTKNTIYTTVNDCSAAGNKTCEYVMIPVVNDVMTHADVQVIAFACVHILSATGGSGKYITFQMSANADKCQAFNSGGSGPGYGIYLPPRLVS